MRNTPSIASHRPIGASFPSPRWAEPTARRRGGHMKVGCTHYVSRIPTQCIQKEMNVYVCMCIIIVGMGQRGHSGAGK